MKRSRKRRKSEDDRETRKLSWPTVAARRRGACKNGEGSSLPFQTVGRQPDVAPVMLNKELPFRYPPALYAQKVQGNVTLRIYIDSNGAIVPDSTRVAETSGFSALDSAAMKGSRDLKFEPAKTRGQPVPVSILLPVFFRHPGCAAARRRFDHQAGLHRRQQHGQVRGHGETCCQAKTGRQTPRSAKPPAR